MDGAGDSLVEKEPVGRKKCTASLENQTLVLLAAAFPLQQGSASSMLKHLPNALVGLG